MWTGSTETRHSLGWCDYTVAHVGVLLNSYSQVANEEVRPMPKWRPFTWVIVVINVLFLVWIIAGVAGTSDSCGGMSGEELEVCEAATAIGASIGVGIIMFLWVLADVILGILWLVTRPKGRPCPVCGTQVKEGVTVCLKCGHDFRAAAGGTVDMPPPPGVTGG